MPEAGTKRQTNNSDAEPARLYCDVSWTWRIEEESALTFDLSGVPKARPLEGMVRALVEVKPIGCHRAELILLDLGLVFQVGLARTKRDSELFRGRPAPEKQCNLALGQVCDLGAKARRIWLAKRDGPGAAAEGCQNLERSGRGTAATARLPHGNGRFSWIFTIEEDSALTFDLSGLP